MLKKPKKKLNQISIGKGKGKVSLKKLSLGFAMLAIGSLVVLRSTDFVTLADEDDWDSVYEEYEDDYDDYDENNFFDEYEDDDLEDVFESEDDDYIDVIDYTEIDDSTESDDYVDDADDYEEVEIEFEELEDNGYPVEIDDDAEDFDDLGDNEDSNAVNINLIDNNDMSLINPEKVMEKESSKPKHHTVGEAVNENTSMISIKSNQDKEEQVAGSEGKHQQEVLKTRDNSKAFEEAITQEFHQLVNQERKAQGVPALNYNRGGLQTAANTRTSEIISNFSHTRPNGQKFTTANGFDQTGSSRGENIQQSYAYEGASASDIAQNLFKNWKESSGHYKNMVSDKYTDQSIGLEFVDNGSYIEIYSSQNFSN